MEKKSCVPYGSKRIEIVHQAIDNLCNHGGNGVHNLFVHYGKDKWEERNITEESSFMDVLSICQRFIDIYSFGIKITDENGKPLKNDKDLMGLLKEQEDVEDISLYLSKDANAQPLLFKLPHDNPSFVSVPRAADVSDNTSETYHDNTRTNGEDSTAEKVRKVRGKNMNKKIISRKSGEKLEIEFYNNRGVGPNHQYWSRHLGKIVRAKNLCPIRVHTWKDMTASDKQIMWDFAKDHFSNPSMESYREVTLEHMSTLWAAWRSSLKEKYMKPCKTKALALKNVPPVMNAEDWAWLVSEKFSSEKFKGGKEDNPPGVAEIFYATRQKKGKVVEPREQEKYDEIVKTIEANALLSHIDVVETCFGPQNHSHVFGFGGGMKRKHFNDPHATHIRELKGKLHEKEE